MLAALRELKEHRRIAGLVESCWEVGRRCREHVERDWFLTRAFLMGHQYARWDTRREALVRLPGKVKKLRLTDNKMLPYYRRQVAKLVKKRPEWQVIPNTTEDADVHAARLGRQVLEHLDRVLDMSRKRRELAQWIFSTGNGYLFDTWDVSANEVSVEVDSPFAWYWPAVPFGPTSVDNMPWGLRVTWRPLSWFLATFPERGHRVKEEKLPTNSKLYQYAVWKEDVRPPNLKAPGALLKELFYRPDGEFPRGLYAAVAGDVVLMLTDFPNYGTEDEPLYEYPVTHFRDIAVPGVFWGWPTSYHAIFLQEDWNAIRSSISSYVRSMAKVKWVVPKGAGFKPGDLNDLHAEVLEYNPVRALPPQQTRISPLPRAVFEALAMIEASFMDLYHQHEVSQAQAPKQVRSSWAFNVLAEIDDIPLTPTHAEFHEGLARVGRHVLIHAASRYVDERLIKVVGRGEQVQIHKLRGADLRGNTDVRVVVGDSLPDSKVAKQAAIMERFTQGLYGPPGDPTVALRVRRMLDDLLDEDIYSDSFADEVNARNEDEKLTQLAAEVAAQPEIVATPEFLTEWLPQAQPYDNDVVHLRVHEQELKRPEKQEFYQTFVGRIEVMLKLLHVQTHVARLLNVSLAPQEQEGVRRKGGQSMPINPPNVPPGNIEQSTPEGTQE